LRLAKISPSAARNASFVLTALLRQLLTVLFHDVANRVANFVASDAASHDYHPVASPLQPCCKPKKTCFYGGVTGLSGRRLNLCGCVWLAVVAGLLIGRSGCRAGQRGDADASPDCFPACVSSLAVSVSGCH
jgi:hypothetical protein